MFSRSHTVTNNQYLRRIFMRFTKLLLKMKLLRDNTPSKPQVKESDPEKMRDYLGTRALCDRKCMTFSRP